MASAWQKTQEFYNWVLESGDPRTDPWPLVYSPLPVTLVFSSYLLVVALGPLLMRRRRPLELRGLLLAYNLAMMALSTYMFHEFLVTSVLGNYSYLCQPVDYSQSELGMRQMARVCWWFFFSKVIELLDTVFFILRKKQEQVTFLHVYHHGSMLFNWWSGVKYVPGGQGIICVRKAVLYFTGTVAEQVCDSVLSSQREITEHGQITTYRKHLMQVWFSMLALPLISLGIFHTQRQCFKLRENHCAG
ncbi:elongation of very long chain fatty acids protein 7-like isoform X3 [Empidonax traillii]|uniref:elongation of very long chain fatty acids protein 7-like isoform X3 n=1 Tax=Empidonax traillii TaxID=164674 RepID=UPI000FFCF1E2|nr:elongation of very long chain fatty acids protein 7-like isoform X3 [Empidonax traillii]